MTAEVTRQSIHSIDGFMAKETKSLTSNAAGPHDVTSHAAVDDA